MKKMDKEEVGETVMDDEKSETMMTKVKKSVLDKNAACCFGSMPAEKKRKSIFMPTITPGNKQGM